MRVFVSIVAGWTLAVLVAGCSQDGDQNCGSATSVEVDGSLYLLSSEPDGARSVIDSREHAKHGDEMVIVGRIGGSTDPWVEGVAAFLIVDESLKACSDIEGDTCPIPWDYCCETDKLPDAKVLVKLIDTDGQVVRANAKQVLKLKELDTVVIRGAAERDDVGNLTVLASRLFVRP